jgi:hypothetical protein
MEETYEPMDKNRIWGIRWDIIIVPPVLPGIS